VLEAMAMLGIDLHWLLLGEGAMWRVGQPCSGIDIGALAEKAQRKFTRELQLGELLLASNASRQADMWHLLNALNSLRPEWITLERLAEVLSLREGSRPLAEIGADLALLVRKGLVEVQAGSPPAYRAVQGGLDINARDVSDINRVAINAVDVLLRDVLPQAECSPSRGRLITVKGHTRLGEGPKLIERLRNIVRTEVERSAGGDEHEEEIALVVGIAVTSSRD
jgi:hypothetical protein